MKVLGKNIFSVLIVMVLIFCWQTTGHAKKKKAVSVEEQESESEDMAVLTEPIREIKGPKRTVAVGRFDAIGAFTMQYGNWDIGGGLSAMLTTALIESDRFIVTERANLGQILSEQELKATGVVNQETGPKLGKLAGVHFLIYGSVTEFSMKDKSGGFSAGFTGSGSAAGLFSSALSRQTSAGAVVIDIRLVDTTTGQVVDSFSVNKTIKAKGWNISGGYKGISLGTNKFNRTPLGRASRAAITEIVQKIAKKAKKTAWTGRVVDVDDMNVVYINAGLTSGIQIGDKFSIERITKTLTDPETGEVLSTRKLKLGSLQIAEVEEKLSYGAYPTGGGQVPVRGDLVIMIDN